MPETYDGRTYVEEDAWICADNLVDADLCGVESHGVSRMQNYMKRLRTGVVDSGGKCTIEKEKPRKSLYSWWKCHGHGSRKLCHEEMY